MWQNEKEKRSEICIVDLNQYFFIWFQCSSVLSSISSFVNEDAIEMGTKTDSSYICNRTL